MAKTALKKTATEKPARAEKKPKSQKKVKVEGASDKAVSTKACKVGGCKRDYRAKGYCQAHYKKWRKGAFGQARYKKCGDALCFKPMAQNRHGLCEDHYQSVFVKGVKTAKPVAAAKPEAKADAGAEKAAANG